MMFDILWNDGVWELGILGIAPNRQINWDIRGTILQTKPYEQRGCDIFHQLDMNRWWYGGNHQQVYNI